MPRRFGDDDRRTLFIANNGECASCGDELKDGWHADHRQAWSRGGQTDVANGQALCPTCNLAKGASDGDGLRPWQQRAIDRYTQKATTDFLVVATPGAGKTRVAGELARRHLATGRVSKVFVVVPSEHLKVQWARSLARVAVDLEPDWDTSHGRLPRDAHGVVVTYQQLAAGSGCQLLRYHLGREPSLAIFDEIHHCGESRAWGTAIERAFEHAAARLALSGTPFRSDNNAIPFVRYVDGVGEPDFVYGYADALDDGVCRPVYFPRRGGRMEWSTGQEGLRVATFDDELDARGTSHRLRTALSVDGDWLSSVLSDAHDALADFRIDDPQAGGLVIAMDQDHARGIAQLLHARCGVEPIVAVSDDRDASSNISRFAESSDPWLVAVKMVSEGVDIPRLRVGVFATNTTTELFFRQAVGRLVRVRGLEIDESACLFIPDDPRLRHFAEQIRAEREHCLAEESQDLLGRENKAATESSASAFTPISSSAIDVGAIFDGAGIRPEELELAERVKSQDPATRRLPTPHVAVILRNAGFMIGPAGVDSLTSSDGPIYERRKALRQANNKAARRIAFNLGLEFREINRRLNRAVGIRTVGEAGVAELEVRLRSAEQWLTTGNAPTEVA